MKLNKSNVDAIALTESGQAIYRDSDLIGFAVRATTKSKVYIVERRSAGKLFRVTIGKTNELAFAEAKKKAQTLLAEIANGTYKRTQDLNENNPTLQQAFDLYLKHKKLKPLSINTYHFNLKEYLADWRNKPIFNINKKQVFDKFLSISEFSESQANLTLKIFGSVWRFAHIHYSTDEEPILKQNPVDVIPAKRGWNKIKPRIRHLDESQITTYYNAVLNYQTERSLYEDEAKNAVRDLVLFIMYTGCRRNEAQTLKWSNVDLDKGIFIFKNPKNGDDHMLPMGEHLLSIMKSRYELKKSDYVFPSSKSATVQAHVSGAAGLLEKVGEETGIYISLHDLRRTFATICNNLDYGQYTIKRLLNHRSGADDVTGQYVQVSIKKLRLAMSDIEAVYQGKLDCFN